MNLRAFQQRFTVYEQIGMTGFGLTEDPFSDNSEDSGDDTGDDV